MNAARGTHVRTSGRAAAGGHCAPLRMPPGKHVFSDEEPGAAPGASPGGTVEGVGCAIKLVVARAARDAEPRGAAGRSAAAGGSGGSGGGSGGSCNGGGGGGASGDVVLLENDEDGEVVSHAVPPRRYWSAIGTEREGAMRQGPGVKTVKLKFKFSGFGAAASEKSIDVFAGDKRAMAYALASSHLQLPHRVGLEYVKFRAVGTEDAFEIFEVGPRARVNLLESARDGRQAFDKQGEFCMDVVPMQRVEVFPLLRMD